MKKKSQNKKYFLSVYKAHAIKAIKIRQKPPHSSIQLRTQAE